VSACCLHLGCGFEPYFGKLTCEFRLATHLIIYCCTYYLASSGTLSTSTITSPGLTCTCIDVYVLCSLIMDRLTNGRFKMHSYTGRNTPDS